MDRSTEPCDCRTETNEENIDRLRSPHPNPRRTSRRSVSSPPARAVTPQQRTEVLGRDWLDQTAVLTQGRCCCCAGVLTGSSRPTPAQRGSGHALQRARAVDRVAGLRSRTAAGPAADGAEHGELGAVPRVLRRYRLCRAEPADEARLAQLGFLVAAAFLLTNKVRSPQYSLWLVPLAVLALPRWKPPPAMITGVERRTRSSMHFLSDMTSVAWRTCWSTPTWCCLSASALSTMSRSRTRPYRHRDAVHVVLLAAGDIGARRGDLFRRGIAPPNFFSLSGPMVGVVAARVLHTGARLAPYVRLPAVRLSQLGRPARQGDHEVLVTGLCPYFAPEDQGSVEPRPDSPIGHIAPLRSFA